MRRNIQRRILFHLLFWVMLALFMVDQMQGYIYQRGWLFVSGPLLSSLLMMAIPVYFNTLVLIPRLLLKKKLVLYITGLVVIFVFYAYGRSLVQQYWDHVTWPNEPMKISEYLHLNTIFAVWLLFLSSMLYYTLKWTEQRQQVKNMQIDQLQTELKYLRSQVNPHFLFNGLNTIYGNIDMKDQRARDILLQFADLLRYNLYEADVDWVDLEKEAIYLQNYVALHRARSNENMQIDLDVDIHKKDLKIAPLLFIPFVENAFKFSTRDDSRPNRIRISLQQNGNEIRFACSNSFEEQDPTSGGIGLSNVKRRLELLYKDRYILNIQKDESTFTVILVLHVTNNAAS